MDRRVDEIIQILKKNNLAVSIDDLAARVRLSPSRLRALFRAQTGSTVHQYQKRLRLEQAARLLSETQLSVKEVRHQTGVDDPSHFNRDFKKVFGMTPKQYFQTAALSLRDDLPEEGSQIRQ